MFRIRQLPAVLLVSFVCALCCVLASATENDTIRELLLVEKQIHQVVAKNMESCVSISDGTGYGSGVVVSEDGLVLTAGHVMTTDKTYDIIFPSGRNVKARPVGKNLDIDAGMLQIIDPGGPWPAVKISSKPVQLGDWVVNIGHSGGFEVGRKPPVRSGRYLRRRGYQLVTDAVLIGGDSGGPLFNLQGELIGIHSSIGDSIAENRHVDIAAFRRHWTRMKSGESWGALPKLGRPEKIVTSAFIGVTVDRKLDNAKVTKVRPGSPADIVGINVGDVVVEFDGEKISSATQLIEKIKQKKPGDICPVAVDRSGNLLRFMIRLRPAR